MSKLLSIHDSLLNRLENRNNIIRIMAELDFYHRNYKTSQFNMISNTIIARNKNLRTINALESKFLTKVMKRVVNG